MSTFWKPTPPEITPSSFTSPVSKTTNRNPFEITSEWIHKRRDLSFEDKFSPIVQLWIKQDNELPIARTDNNQIIKDFVQLLKNIPLEIQFEIISFIPTLTMRRHISLLKTKEKFKEMTENTISTIRSNRKLNLLFENPLSSLEEEQLNYEKDILFIYQEDSLLYSFLKNRIICKEFKRKFEHLIAQNFINNGLNLTFLIKEDVFGYPYKEVDGRYKFAFCLIRYLNNLSNAEQSIKSTENVTEIFNENFVKEFDNIFSPKFNDQFFEHKGKIDPFLTGCIKQIKKEEKNEKKEIPKKEKKSSEGFQFTFANKEDSNTSSNNTTPPQQPLMTESKSNNNFNFSKTTHKEDSKSDTTISSGATTGIFNFKFDIKESSEKIKNNSGNLFNLPNIASNSNSNTQFNFENTKKVKAKKNFDKNKNPICLNPNIEFDNYAPNVINDSKITLKEEINKIIDNYNENLNNIPKKIEDDFIQRFKNQFIIPQLQSNTFDETLKKILSKQKDDSNLFNLSESTNYKKEFKSVERDYSKVLDYLIEKSIHLTNIKKLILHKRNCFNREISLLLTLLPNLEHLTFVELSFTEVYKLILINNVTHPKLLKLECINVHTIFSNKEEVKLKLRKLFPSLFCLILHFNSMKKVLFPVLFKSSFGKLDNLFQLEYCDFNDKMIIEKKKDDIFVFLSSLQNHLENNNLKQFVND
ncbi:hypothetical protein ABK040_005378 [Willaertia magna]